MRYTQSDKKEDEKNPQVKRTDSESPMKNLGL